jgi:D-alanyl-D-alanine carboxypeptidase
MKKLDFDVLVNRDNRLASDYVPKDLYVLDNNENNFHKYAESTLKPMLSLEIKEFLDLMLNDARLNGFNIIVDSGYRSFKYQEKVLAKLLQEKGDVAYNLVALPGASEHQTGLAFDVAYFKDGIFYDDHDENSLELKWLKNNSYKYGFILRYPQFKESITGYSYEPWHFRFVGLEVAKKLHDEDITLEEYFALYKNKQ